LPGLGEAHRAVDQGHVGASQGLFTWNSWHYPPLKGP
jgi:hypothetical protein